MVSFLDKARGLSRNPLGIIALFIALIYGFATLLLGVAASKLLCGERLPLVWFVVLFPVLVLAVFYLLVTRHHWKLYSPRDYRTDKSFQDASFLTRLTSAQKEHRANEELASIHPEVVQPSPVLEPGGDTAAALPTHDAIPVPPPVTNPDELRARLRLAERLALKKIQRDRGLDIKSQVAFGNDASAAFDGVAQTGTSCVAIEVKLLRESWTRPLTIREVLYRAMVANHILQQRFGDSVEFRLLLVFVVEKGAVDRSRLGRLIETTLKEAPITVEWEIFGLADLEKEFPEVTAET
jgi:hypothetical protein